MRHRFVLALLALVVAIVMGGAPVASAADEWVIRQSRQDVAETTRRLEDAIVRSGSVVLGVIDHQAAAARVGEQLPAMTVVLFAKPKASTPLMRDNRRLGIDLPQRILVWEENGATNIGYISPYSLATRYGMNGDREEWEDMRRSLDALAQAASSRGDRRQTSPTE